MYAKGAPPHSREAPPLWNRLLFLFDAKQRTKNPAQEFRTFNHDHLHRSSPPFQKFCFCASISPFGKKGSSKVTNCFHDHQKTAANADFRRFIPVLIADAERVIGIQHRMIQRVGGTFNADVIGRFLRRKQ